MGADGGVGSLQKNKEKIVMPRMERMCGEKRVKILRSGEGISITQAEELYDV